jgi:hypothetical protein
MHAMMTVESAEGFTEAYLTGMKQRRLQMTLEG